MTIDQITLLRNQHLKQDADGKPNANATVIVFDGGLSFETDNDPVIWDDKNLLIHEIGVNSLDAAPVETAQTPFRITTGVYDNIHYIEGLYDMKNFTKAVDDLFVKPGLITPEQHTGLLSWANNIRNMGQQATRATPYYTENADIVPMVPNPMKRDDGIETITTPNTGITGKPPKP